MVYITKTAEETFELGRLIGHNLVGGAIVTLNGELGAGKTTLAQGIAAGLGIMSRITSPTFIIQRTYDVPESARGIKNFYHVDLYRLEKADDDVQELGITHEWGRSENVFVIEWPDRLSFIPPHIDVELISEQNGNHTISLSGIELHT
jgi:tRNA threonylcarbamoyladenosine biosynthesis protein TsaE